jgi:hypothetical protein
MTIHQDHLRKVTLFKKSPLEHALLPDLIYARSALCLLERKGDLYFEILIFA